MSDLVRHGNGKSDLELRQVLSPLLVVFSLSLLLLLWWVVVFSLSLLVLLSLLVVLSLSLLVLLSLQVVLSLAHRCEGKVATKTPLPGVDQSNTHDVQGERQKDAQPNE